MWDNTGPSCDACKAPMGEAYDFVDRHGDVEKLCGCCYIAALHPARAAHADLMAWLCVAAYLSFLLAVVL